MPLSKDPKHPESEPTPSHIWVVEQIGDLWVSVEVDGEQFERIPKWLFPPSLAEGAVFRVEHEISNRRAVLSIVLDPEERARLLQRSRRQIEQAKQKDSGTGDIVL